MANFRKRGKTWAVSVRRKGQHEYATFPTKAEAAEWAAERERAIRHGQVSIAHKRTLGELLEAFQRHRERDWDQTRLLWFMGQPIAPIKLSDLTPSKIEGWMKERGKVVSDETIRRDLGLLSAALTWAVREKWIPESPLRGVKRPEEGEARERTATEQEVQTIMHVAGYELGSKPETVKARIAAAFVFAVETSMMPIEICRMDKTWFHGTFIRCPKVKTRPKRDVPLTARAKQVLKDVDYNFNLTPTQIDANWREHIRPDAAVDGLNFYDSRATALTRLSKKYDVLALAKIAGHKDLNRLIKSYYRETGEELAKRLE